jgi:hypothetical protein
MWEKGVQTQESACVWRVKQNDEQEKMIFGDRTGFPTIGANIYWSFKIMGVPTVCQQKISGIPI